ncbi:MAG: transcriptional regulator PpsR [Parvularculaceae bacterium]
MIASAADVALVLDGGVIKDVAVGDDALAKDSHVSAWRGKPWIDTVTIESKPKIEDLLSGAAPKAARWRQVNHPSPSGADVPVAYITVSTGAANRFVAVGRDLRATAALQQRLIETHQDLEREYARLREAESRYRLLFDTTNEPVLIVSAASLAIEEANPAARRLIGVDEGTTLRGDLSALMRDASRREVERLAAAALSLGKATSERVALKDGAAFSLIASAFRQGEETKLIVRLAREDRPACAAASPRARGDGPLESVMEHLPDGLLVGNGDLRVLAANRAFVAMAQLVGAQQAVGEPLTNWLGRSATEINMLVSNLKSHGAVRNFATVVRDRFGVEEDVEICAVSAPCETDARYGFSIRSVARRLPSGPRLGETLPSSVDQVTGLVGRMPLKEIVRESTDLIEKLCIEAALGLASDNRASAAEILGLSRQGLYSKLKRFGIDDAG